MPRFLRALAAVAVVMLVLDLTWLGIAAAPLYDRGLAHLKAPEVNVVAAGLFYAMYVVVTTLHALPGATVKAAAGRGAALGFVAYATYELTNWAVLRDWPAWLVPIDVAWGIFLTALSGAVARLAGGPPPPAR
jgi:uncharacterized membrane protein